MFDLYRRGSPADVTAYTIGKDVVQVASVFYGGFAAKGKQLGEAVEETGGRVRMGADDAAKNLAGKGLREAYTTEVGKLKDVGESMFKAGKSEAEVAQTLNQMRRDLGVKYKDLTPDDLKEFIYEFNRRRYKDELGPTYDYLKKLNPPRSDKAIIESASRPLGTEKQLGEALYKEFGDEIKSVLEKYDMIPNN